MSVAAPMPTSATRQDHQEASARDRARRPPARVAPRATSSATSDASTATDEEWRRGSWRPRLEAKVSSSSKRRWLTGSAPPRRPAAARRPKAPTCARLRSSARPRRTSCQSHRRGERRAGADGAVGRPRRRGTASIRPLAAEVQVTRADSATPTSAPPRAPASRPPRNPRSCLISVLHTSLRSCAHLSRRRRRLAASCIVWRRTWLRPLDPEPLLPIPRFRVARAPRSRRATAPPSRAAAAAPCPHSLRRPCPSTQRCYVSSDDLSRVRPQACATCSSSCTGTLTCVRRRSSSIRMRTRALAADLALDDADQPAERAAHDAHHVAVLEGRARRARRPRGRSARCRNSTTAGSTAAGTSPKATKLRTPGRPDDAVVLAEQIDAREQIAGKQRPDRSARARAPRLEDARQEGLDAAPQQLLLGVLLPPRLAAHDVPLGASFARLSPSLRHLRRCACPRAPRAAAACRRTAPSARLSRSAITTRQTCAPAAEIGPADARVEAVLAQRLADLARPRPRPASTAAAARTGRPAAAASPAPVELRQLQLLADRDDVDVADRRVGHLHQVEHRRAGLAVRAGWRSARSSRPASPSRAGSSAAPAQIVGRLRHAGLPASAPATTAGGGNCCGRRRQRHRSAGASRGAGDRRRGWRHRRAAGGAGTRRGIGGAARPAGRRRVAPAPPAPTGGTDRGGRQLSDGAVACRAGRRPPRRRGLQSTVGRCCRGSSRCA